jgi:hypothetical protein
LRNAVLQKSDLLPVVLVSACAVFLAAAGLYAGVSPWQAAMTLVGATACHALFALEARAPHVPYGYIQTGEGAAGAFAVVAAALFITVQPLIIAGIVLAVILLFQFYLRFIISPDAGETALSGAAVNTVAAILIARIAWGDAPGLVGPAGSALTGYIGSLPAGLLAPAAAAASIAASYLLVRLFGPELASYAEGREFCCRPGREYAITTACIIAIRSILVSIALLFSGWLSGMGRDAGRLYRGAFPDAFSLMALLAFSQGMLLVAQVAGSFAAAACACAASYVLFILNFMLRDVRYDRRETL